MFSISATCKIFREKTKQFLAAFIATIIAFGGGTTLGWTSPTASQLTDNCTDEFPFILDEEQFSWVSSALNLGAVSSCLIIGYLINIIGRKHSLLILVFPAVIGWALILSAENFAMMVIGRVFLGVFTGGIFVVTPLYIGEIAEKEIRGILGTFTQLMVTLGIFFVYSVGPALDSAFDLSKACVIPPMFFAAIFVLMPETPTYFIHKNQINDAKRSLRWLRGQNYDPTEEIQILQQEKEEREQLNRERSLLKSFQRLESQLALIIVIGLMFFQQMCGINAVIFYTHSIFAAANTNLSESDQTIIVGGTQVVMTMVATILVDKLGRKPLLILSEILMAFCTASLGVYFYMKDKDEESVRTFTWLPITSISIFIVGFSVGFGPIPFLVLGEICAPDIKGIAVGTALTVNWTLSFLITKYFRNTTELLGIGQTFWIFTIVCILGGFFILVMLPETRGISMEQIQEKLKNFNLFNCI